MAASVHDGFATASSAIRGVQYDPSLRRTSSTMLGFEVAPVAPRATA